MMYSYFLERLVVTDVYFSYGIKTTENISQKQKRNLIVKFSFYNFMSVRLPISASLDPTSYSRTATAIRL